MFHLKLAVYIRSALLCQLPSVQKGGGRELVLQISTKSVKMTLALILSVSSHIVLRCLEPTREGKK